MKKEKIGIIGNGDFGKFLCTHLSKYFSLESFDREDIKKVYDGDLDQIQRINSVDYLIFAVTLNGLEDVCKKISGKISADIILVDVMSIKVPPINIMNEYFPANQILATHPIFGPQSGKNGLKNLPIVLTNVSLEDSLYLKIKQFLSEKLELNILEKTLEQHDIEMAYIQGLSHFIGRAIEVMDIKSYDTNTYSYTQLLKLKELVGGDSFELYKTIQNGNKYAVDIRKKFLQVLNDLEKSIEDKDK